MPETTQSKSVQKGTELRLFIDHLKDAWDIIKTPKKSNGPRERYYYTIFTKLMFTLDGIIHHITNLDEIPHYNVAAVLCLRTCLLDVMGLYYVMDAHEDEVLIKERLDLIMADHLMNTYKDFSTDEKDAVKKLWPDLFDGAGNLKKHVRTGTELFTKGLTKFQHLKDDSAQARAIYLLFSKYEHNGAFTFNLLHNPYTAKGKQMIDTLIYDAIGICALACKLVSTHWLDDTDDLSKRVDKAITDLLQH